MNSVTRIESRDRFGPGARESSVADALAACLGAGAHARGDGIVWQARKVSWIGAVLSLSRAASAGSFKYCPANITKKFPWFRMLDTNRHVAP